MIVTVFIRKYQTITGSLFGSGEKLKGTARHIHAAAAALIKGCKTTISPEKYEHRVCCYFEMHTAKHFPIIW